MENYYELKLPSKLIPYNGVSKVEARMLKGKDEKLLSELTIANFDKKFKILLDNVLRGIDPAELTVGDRFYIVVWLALNCYSDIYPIETMCEHCLRKIKLDIKLSTLEKVEINPDYKEPYPLELIDGSKINLRLLRIKDLIQYSDYTEIKGQDDILYKLAQSVVSEDDLMKKMEFLAELPTKDIGLIRAFHDKYFHGVRLETGYSCPKCGGAGITPVPFRLDILLPNGETVAKSLGRSV